MQADNLNSCITPPCSYWTAHACDLSVRRPGTADSSGGCGRARAAPERKGILELVLGAYCVDESERYGTSLGRSGKVTGLEVREMPLLEVRLAGGLGVQLEVRRGFPAGARPRASGVNCQGS
eukprot:1060217-Rhodomonas_salina.2